MSDSENTAITLRPNLPGAYHVLIVDDDESIREHLSALVSHAGYEVHTAASGEQALKFVDAAPCPIVVTDWQMPDMDGLTLCRALRSRGSESYIYVLLLTVRNDKADIVAGFSAGADDYVCKTASPEELLARLEVGRRIINLEQSLRQANAENRRMATTDALTGARNRHYLMKYLPREFERCRRYHHSIAVLACDIDHFKRINDAYGHDAGDEVLKELVDRAMTTLRLHSDWIARSGGEEFIIVLPETDLQGATTTAERLHRMVSGSPFPTSAGPLKVTVSIGVSSLGPAYDLQGTSSDELLRLADRGLYASKEAGRNCSTALQSSQHLGDPPEHTPTASQVAAQLRRADH